AYASAMLQLSPGVRGGRVAGGVQVLSAKREVVQRPWAADVDLPASMATDLHVANRAPTAGRDATAFVADPQAHGVKPPRTRSRTESDRIRRLYTPPPTHRSSASGRRGEGSLAIG